MADTLMSLSLLVLAQEFRGDTVRQVNRKCQGLKVLQIRPGGGKNCAWAPEGDGQIAENYAEGADAANFGSDEQDSAVLSWGQYRANIHVSTLAMDAAASSSSPLGNKIEWGRQVANASAKLASLINQKLYSGPGTGTELAGLGVAIGDDVNTYATIDRTVKTFWRPTVVDPGVLTSPTFAQIRSDLGKIYDACGEVPDIAFCPTDIFNTIGGLFDQTRRYTQEIQTARGAITLDAGYGAIDVDGCMFLKDKDATANTINYVNTNHLWLEYLPDSRVPREFLEEAQQVSPNDGYGAIPLGFRYDKLAKNGDSDRGMITSRVQLVCDRPNSCGVRKNVAAAA